MAYAITRDIWHSAGINGHYPFDKVFPLSASEVQLPVRKRIYTMSQLMEVDDLSGHLMLGLAPYPLIQLKLWHFIWVLWLGPSKDKVVSLVTAKYSLFQLGESLSLSYSTRNKKSNSYKKLFKLGPHMEHVSQVESSTHTETHFSMTIKSSLPYFAAL